MEAGTDNAQDRQGIDPITLEVIRHGIIGITNQIDANITRTAFSPYIYEYKDFAVGLVDAEGQLVAQSTGGMPPFVADSVGTAVRDGLKVYGREKLCEGDIVLCNHAAVQGQHLNNTVMYTPIHGGPGNRVLIGFFAINVHWIDIGGSTPRSSDIFEEGLQLRSIKLWSKGAPIEEVYRIIENNTRLPVELMGDISAQLAGCQAAETVHADVFIREMPDGVYETHTELDNDGDFETPIPIRVKITVKGDSLTVDYSGMGEVTPGCINSGYFGGGVTTARVAFKYLVVPQEAANEGIFRPLSLVLPEGTILSAPPTAPMGTYSMPFPTVIDAVIRAFEKAMPDHVTGGHFATHSGFRIYGRSVETGEAFNGHDSGHGGWGACAWHDGTGPFRTMAHGDTRLIPMELQETILPFRIDEMSLREDSGGAGKYRGGLGFRKKYTFLRPCLLQTNLDRTLHPPWGVAGGKAAQSGCVTVYKGGRGKGEVVCKAKGYPLAPGDTAILETGGGGGYGEPKDRDLGLIQRDLERGYVTRQAARRDYGVTITRDGKVRRA